MLDGIDALIALDTYGTVSEAATRLRLTQSAVSKRLQALKEQVGCRLVVPDGRRLKLTPAAMELIDRARPLLAELRGLVKPVTRGSRASFSLALADSVASSWGPGVVRRAVKGLADLDLQLHAHRSVLVVESVRLGRYDIGMCTETAGSKDLMQHGLVDEPIVLAYSGLSRKLDGRLPLIAIEPTSATWRAIQPTLRARYPELVASELVFVESFGAAYQMLKAGFGNALLPQGLAMDSKIPGRSLRALPGVARRVSLLTRKSLYREAAFTSLRDALTDATREHFAGRRGTP
jgi:DNA-binding transcriptional LysR family regulator